MTPPIASRATDRVMRRSCDTFTVSSGPPATTEGYVVPGGRSRLETIGTARRAVDTVGPVTLVPDREMW